MEHGTRDTGAVWGKKRLLCKKKPSQVKYKIILDKPLKWTPKLPISIIYVEINYLFLVLLRRPTKVTFFFFFFIHGPLYYSNLLMWRLGTEILNIELQCVSFRIKGVNLILGAVPV